MFESASASVNGMRVATCGSGAMAESDSKRLGQHSGYCAAYVGGGRRGSGGASSEG